MIKNKIENLIKDSLKKLEIGEVNFVVEHPEDFKNGDYSTNVAMTIFGNIRSGFKSLSKDLSKDNTPYSKDDFERAINNGVEVSDKINIYSYRSPLDIAKYIKTELDKNLSKEILKIEVAGSGFINFYISKEYFQKELANIITLADKYGSSDLNKEKKILVEHSSPNLFKPFHVGHMMNNAIGESITRLAHFSGAEVKAISFPSDISLGVAKAIFIILEKQIDGQIFKPVDIVALGDAYVEGTKRYDEDEFIHARVKEIADNLYSEKDSPEFNAFVACKEFNMEYFKNITKRLGSEFDGYIYESEAGIIGKKMVLENTPDIFTESEGAVVYIPEETKKYINTAVFINSQGNPTYEAKDLGLLDLKFEKYNPDLSIFITDHQQISHFAVVLDAVEKINKSWVDRSVHRTHGRMTFKGQKMSSRLGGVPLVADILETVLAEVSERTKDRDTVDTRENPEAIAVGALKFAILRAQAGKNIDFDPETSLSFEGDSGPYLQYTGVRANSVLEKAGKEINISEIKNTTDTVSDVEKILARFPEVVENSITNWAPHYVTTYLCELAQSFNSWYAHTQIIDEANPNMNYNLAITKSVAQVMQNGLWLLGITLPERM